MFSNTVNEFYVLFYAFMIACQVFRCHWTFDRKFIVTTARPTGTITHQMAIFQHKWLSYGRKTVLQGGLVMATSGRLEVGDNLRALFYLQPLWRNGPAKQQKSVEKHEIRDITLFKVIQCHQGRYQSKACMRLPISDLVPFRSYRSLLFEFWPLCVM